MTDSATSTRPRTMAWLLACWPERLRFWRGQPNGAATTAAELPSDYLLTRPFPWESQYPPGLEWPLDVRPAPLSHLLDEAVATYGSRPCLDFLGRKSTYR